MNDVRHAWTTFRSSSKSSTLSSNMSNEGNQASTTTWYDIPAPIIIHCHDFREDEVEMIGKKKEDVKTCEEESSKPMRVNSTVSSNDEIPVVEEALYQNSVDIVGHENSNDIQDESRLFKIIASDPKVNEETSSQDRNRKHSTSIELMATTYVRTDEDGVPKISFSFLQGDELLEKNDQGDEEENDEDKNDRPESSLDDRLYDFPKKSSRDDDNEAEKNDKRSIQEDSSNVANELYDKPKPISDKNLNDASNDTDNDTSKEITVERKIIPITFRAHGSSLRSLKSRKRKETFGSDTRDTGLTSTSGCYSDPEFSNDTASNVSHGLLKSEKRKLGKAWGKMRSWLRDERSKLSEVIQRHARMQNVGAMIGEPQENNQEMSLKDLKTSKGRSYASYDLAKARTQELGSITRVEEFGISLLTKETNENESSLNVSRRSNSYSPDSGKAYIGDTSAEEDMVVSRRNVLCKKTASSDDILGNGKRSPLPPVSFSMDKLCSDTENDEMCVASTEHETTARDRAGKGGMIKRRMLGSIRGLMASTHLLQTNEIHEEGGQGGFEDIRRYVKQGGDFCKELASILHERAELEATYAKGLSKLSSKLTKACSKDQSGNSNGGVNEAWRCVGEEMEAAAEAHRIWGIALGEQLAKPLRVGVAEAQGRSRKSIENSVDKALKSLQEWRNIASKTKKQSFSCARENERLQDLARLQSISQSQQNNNKSSNHHMTEKEASKLEARRRKAEDSSRRADTEFYTVSVRAERARLEYESTVRKGAKQMELLEEERLSALKDFVNVYLAHLQALAPRLQQSADRLSTPIRNCNVSQDVEILKNLIRRIESNDTVNAEQLLPDFYAEHITLAMNRERRKQSLVRILHLIRQDLERERRGREGLETLHRAFVKTPAFAADESTQNVTDKLHHMRSMLLYLEAARYKVGGTLAEVEGSKRSKHPLAEHILVSRDKQGLQQSVLKIPSWARNESFEIQDIDDEIEVHLAKGHETESRDWADRTAGDGNSENPPDEEDFSDFDEFSSHSEDNNNQDVDVVDVTPKSDRIEQCRAIYHYSANLNDELSLNPGDLITVHQKQADGWWIGECRGRTGIFPATYVQVIH